MAVAPIGHDALIARFAAALRRGALHHAWLIAGPRGVGKSLVARWLAQLALCRTHEACGRCDACQWWEAGVHPDAQWLARQATRRDIVIDDVREAQRWLALAPAAGAMKVLVIDEAETMNAQAANALLKTLEEPPQGALILLVAHDPMRLLPTVRSRCVRLEAGLLSPEATRAVLAAAGWPEPLQEKMAAIAAGRPGIVAGLNDAEARALLTWMRLCEAPEKADIAEAHAWTRAHAGRIPSDAIAAASIAPWRERNGLDWALAEALSRLARWPEEARRFSLRPAASLFARWLALRRAARACARERSGEHRAAYGEAR
ncbi:MAG: DNA polymerase III subunit delta' [Zetaproteobacteria bacterium]|nr:MAG: DNA polymerase III subunit delta' [Zetaproteobacteria bacterium]